MDNEEIHNDNYFHSNDDSKVIGCQSSDTKLWRQIQCKYHLYSGVGGMTQAFYKGMSISLFQMCSSEYGCIVHGRKLVPLKWPHYVRTTLGLSYHHWIICDVDCRRADAIVLSDIACSSLLLPHLSKGGLNESDAHLIYAFIDCDWTEMQADGSMGSSRVPGYNYDIM